MSNVGATGNPGEPHGSPADAPSRITREFRSLRVRDLEHQNGPSHLLLQKRLERREYEEKPDKVTAERPWSLLRPGHLRLPLGIEAKPPSSGY